MSNGTLRKRAATFCRNDDLSGLMGIAAVLDLTPAFGAIQLLTILSVNDRDPRETCATGWMLHILIGTVASGLLLGALPPACPPGWLGKGHHVRRPDLDRNDGRRDADQ
jgi:hypothetical protein